MEDISREKDLSLEEILLKMSNFTADYAVTSNTTLVWLP